VPMQNCKDMSPTELSMDFPRSGGSAAAPGLFGRHDSGAGISRNRKVVSSSPSEGLCGAFGLWLSQQ